MTRVTNRELWNAGALYGDPALIGAREPGAKRQRKPGTVTEWHEQQAVIQWWDSYSQTKGIDYRLLFSVPNGVKLGRDPKSRMVEMVMLKKTGLRPGVSDLVLAIARKQYHGLYGEMKSMEGRPSSDQIEFAELVTEQGYLHAFWYGASEAIEAIKGYLG